MFFVAAEELASTTQKYVKFWVRQEVKSFTVEKSFWAELAL